MLISDDANGSTCHKRRMLLDRGFGASMQELKSCRMTNTN